MATAIHLARSLCCAMCYPVLHIVSDDLRTALILHLVPAHGGSTWGEATSMPRSKTPLLLVLQDPSPTHSSVFTVESIFSAFQLLAHSPWVLPLLSFKTGLEYMKPV